MLWFCGGHGACLTSPGDLSAIEREELAWLARYLKRDASADTGPGFEWVDQDGTSYGAPSYPLVGGAPLTGTGSGTLALVNGGGSGPATYTGNNPTAAIAAPVAATKATNAVNVRVPAAHATTSLVGAPTVTLTYTGTGTALTTGTKVFAQVVDDATGVVLGNQITPIPVTLDARPHTITAPLEIVSATAKPGETFTLQLVASSTAYDIQRSGGAVHFSRIHVELPTADLAASHASRLPSGGRAAHKCTSRRRFTIHLHRRYRGRLRSARVLIGKRVVGRMRRGHLAVRLDLRGRPPGPVTVRIVMRLRHGHAKVDARHYHLCAPKRKKPAKRNRR
jgi:ABC-2 type transport system ATP-binding protein